MLQEQRRAIILEVVDRDGIASMAELVETLGVSVATVRRDLTEMAASGLIRRTHGGAVSTAGSHFEFSYTEADAIGAAEKREIALTAAAIVKDGDTVLLDSGTTTEQIARALAQRDITIITNSAVLPPGSMEFRPTLLFTGGIYRPAARSMVGPQAERSIQSMRPDKAFIAANGVSLSHVMTPDVSEAAIKRAMISVSKEKYLVADRSKFGKRYLSVVADVGEFDALITDSGMPPETRKYYQTFVPVLSQASDESHAEAGAAKMNIEELLKPSAITLELQAVQRDAAIRELIGLLVAQGISDEPESLFEAVLQREAQFSTGIGMGIAIPHAKSACVKKAALAFGRSRVGVSGFSPEDPSVKLVFLIAVPQTAADDHLRILAQISRKLVHEDVRHRLLTASTPEEVLEILA